MNKYENLEKKLKNREKVLGTTMSMINSPLVIEKFCVYVCVCVCAHVYTHAPFRKSIMWEYFSVLFVK